MLLSAVFPGLQDHEDDGGDGVDAFKDRPTLKSPGGGEQDGAGGQQYARNPDLNPV